MSGFFTTLPAERARSWSDHAVVVGLIVTTFALCLYPLSDTDFWWHLRTGQLIWERGEVPRTDWYLFTDSDRPWIDLHWGFQLLIAGLYSLGGVNLVILVKAGVITAAVAVAWFATGRELPTWLRAVLWMPAIVCISGRAYERPEMLTQLFLAVWLWIAFRAEAQPRWMWALPVVQMVWINCHALFVLGLVVGACYAVDHVMRRFAAGRWGLAALSESISTRQLFGVGGLCVASALLNPYLLEGALFPLVLYRKFSVEQEFYATRIGEFQRPMTFFAAHGFSNIYLTSEMVLAVMAMISFGVLLLVGHRWSPFRWLLFAGFANLAWEASRNTNIFAIVAATMLAANLAELWKLWPEIVGEDPPAKAVEGMGAVRRSQAAPAAAESGPPFFRFSRRGVQLGNLAVSVLFVWWIGLTMTGVWGRIGGEQKLFGWGERPWWFGHEAVKFAGQPGFPERAMVAHIGLAATYEYHNGPSHKVYLDPRLEVATQKTFLAHETILFQMQQGDRRWEATLKDGAGRLPVVILDSRYSRPALDGLLRTPGWRLVYADPSAGVFLPDGQADALNLKRADYTPLMYPP